MPPHGLFHGAVCSIHTFHPGDRLNNHIYIYTCHWIHAEILAFQYILNVHVPVMGIFSQRCDSVMHKSFIHTKRLLDSSQLCLACS